MPQHNTTHNYTKTPNAQKSKCIAFCRICYLCHTISFVNIHTLFLRPTSVAKFPADVAGVGELVLGHTKRADAQTFHGAAGHEKIVAAVQEDAHRCAQRATTKEHTEVGLAIGADQQFVNSGLDIRNHFFIGIGVV